MLQQNTSYIVTTECSIDNISIDQPAHHPPTSRTPLHHSARNGHYLSTLETINRTIWC